MDWFKNRSKKGIDFPNVPLLIDNGKKITESNAIIDYILNKTNNRHLRGVTPL